MSALAAAALASTLALAGPADEPGARVATILASAEGADADELGRELGALGPDATPLLVDALVAGHVPGGAGDTLDGAQRAALVGGIAAQPAAWPAAIRELIERDARPVARLAALEILSVCATGASFDLAIRAASGVEPADARVPRALEDALASLLQRDVAAYALVPALVESAAAELGPALARGAAAAARPEALDALVRIAELKPDLELVILPPIGRIAHLRPDADLEPARALVRRSLARTDDQILREAVCAAAKLRDHASIERLLELVEHEHRGVRETSFWALETLTGLTLSRRAERWRAWYAGERAWWDAAAPAVLADLGAGESGAVMRALGELGSRRLHRDRIVRSVEPVLRHDDVQLRMQAIALVSRVASAADAALLVPCLRDASSEVVLAAWRGLTSLTGLELPLDAVVWARALEPGDPAAPR